MRSTMDWMLLATTHPGEHGIVTAVLWGASGWRESTRGRLGCANRARVSAAQVFAIPTMCGSFGLEAVAEGARGSGRGGAAMEWCWGGRYIAFPHGVRSNGAVRCQHRVEARVGGPLRGRWHRRCTRGNLRRRTGPCGREGADGRALATQGVDGASASAWRVRAASVRLSLRRRVVQWECRGGGGVRGLAGACGEAFLRRPQTGGAAWHGRAGGDHRSVHVRSGIGMILSSQGHN